MRMHVLYHHELHSLAFVDKFKPHVVFYAELASITFALWSREKHGAFDQMKNMKLRQSVKKPLKQTIKMAGVHAAAGIHKVEYNDSYTEDGKIWGLRERLGFPDMDFMKELRAECETQGGTVPLQWIDKVNQSEREILSVYGQGTG